MSSGVFFVILNVEKNLAVSTNAERLASLEILRFAQDDDWGGFSGFNGFL